VHNYLAPGSGRRAALEATGSDALLPHGVHVAGETAPGAMPAAARVVTERQSSPLSQLPTPFLKLSNNGIAEILTKAAGQKARGEGSWAAGLAVVTDTQGKLGVERQRPGEIRRY
jgi:serine-type D-Ala-D-Ala carboxypeptidase/endopeptidase (penicillin-binding protein 4)